jgi:hypothetical protein
MKNQKRHEAFYKRLCSRIQKHGMEKLSEDCIRYDYFSALCETEGTAGADAVLEYPHPDPRYNTKKGRKIDCVIFAKGKATEALEFKYFPSKKDQHFSKNAGDLLADCYRLLDTDIPLKTLVLVTAEPMQRYIENPANGFDFLLGKETGGKVSKDFPGARADTVLASVRKKTYDGFKPFGFVWERIFLVLYEPEKLRAAVYRVTRK